MERSLFAIGVWGSSFHEKVNPSSPSIVVVICVHRLVLVAIHHRHPRSLVFCVRVQKVM
jgi:hypothetical protein